MEVKPFGLSAQCGTNNLSCLRGVKLNATTFEAQPWHKEPCVMGIDEAGRGPVLGPMVYACVFAPAKDNLTSRAFADSKTLTSEKRDCLYSSIVQDQRLGWVSDILSAAFISMHMLGRHKTSLNVLAMDSTYKLIEHTLSMGVAVKEVFVDTVGDAERYEAALSKRFPSLKFTVCPKADALYPVVSAASIVAKDVGMSGNLGTGYPGDATTQAWLAANVDPVHGWPLIARFSWSTCATILKDKGIAFEWEADEEGNGNCGQQRLSFGPAAGGSGTSAGGSAAALVETSAVGRHSYFRVRKMQRINECF